MSYDDLVKATSIPPQPVHTTAPAEAAGSRRCRNWFRRNPVAAFLIALAFALVTAPFEEMVRYGDLVEAMRFTVVLVAPLLALGDRRRALIWGVVLGAPALAGKWAAHGWPELVPAWVFLVPGLLFVGFVTQHLLRFIVRAPRVDSEVLCAGVASYVLLGLFWALAYILVEVLVPGSFNFSGTADPGQSMKGFTAMYFSFITLCTVGYGDIAPLSGPARMLAMTEAMTGTLYMAVLVARLVSLYSSGKPVPADMGTGNPGARTA